jgi:uncharacterized protein YbgA (DUF1722 family)/uncharacterized protein YbbK (DUF523 family)
MLEVLELTEFPKPKVVVSRCIEFDSCRYNGQMISSEFVKSLEPYVEFLPICPEVEIGLGVPRNSLRLVSAAKVGETRLVQPSTGRDVTPDMQSFAATFLESIGEVDGFILKAGSPSCGIKKTKAYPTAGKSAALSRSEAGIFGAIVLARYPDLAVEDEGRLRNPRVKEHFLTKLFTLARFREVERSGSMGELVRFQTENKMLLMAYNQTEQKALGNIVANHDNRPFDEVVGDYEAHLLRALCRARRYTSNINVLMHILGYLSDRLSAGEKAMFLDNLQRYRDGKITICPNTTLLKSWTVRFEDDYLLSQTFFEPYPQDLIEVDPVVSHKGRNLWK